MRFLPLLLLLLAAGCRQEDAAVIEQKLDAPLRQKMEALEASGSDETLAVFGKCSAPIDEMLRAQLAKTGAEIQSVTGDLFTARGTTREVMKLAAVEAVTQLQLSTTSQPSTP